MNESAPSFLFISFFTFDHLISDSLFLLHFPHCFVAVDLLLLRDLLEERRFDLGFTLGSPSNHFHP